MEPTTAERLGIEQRKWLTEHPERAEENDVRRLMAHIGWLEKAARQNSERCKADNAWAMESYDTLKAELEKARERYAAMLEVLEDPATCTCTFYDLGELEPPPNCPRCKALKGAVLATEVKP